MGNTKPTPTFSGVTFGVMLNTKKFWCYVWCHVEHQKLFGVIPGVMWCWCYLVLFGVIWCYNTMLLLITGLDPIWTDN